MVDVGPPSGGHGNYRPPSGGRTTTHQGERAGMADLRTARRTAEKIARDALGGPEQGAAQSVAGDLLRGPARGAQVGHPGPFSLVSGCPPARGRAVVAGSPEGGPTSTILVPRPVSAGDGSPVNTSTPTTGSKICECLADLLPRGGKRLHHSREEATRRGRQTGDPTERGRIAKTEAAPRGRTASV